MLWLRQRNRATGKATDTGLEPRVVCLGSLRTMGSDPIRSLYRGSQKDTCVDARIFVDVQKLQT